DLGFAGDRGVPRRKASGAQALARGREGPRPGAQRRRRDAFELFQPAHPDADERAPAHRGQAPDAGDRRDIARIQAISTDCRPRFGTGGPSLFGAFSIADAMYAPVASRFHPYGVELAAPANAYAQTLLGLPAFQAWVKDANAEAEVNPQ